MINKNIFSVSNGVIKHIVHERHRHQRELLLNSERDANWKDLEKRRKHANSRQSDKQERRNKTIDNSEVSKTDSDNPNKQKIIIRDLKWRSATLRSFLRNYVDNAALNARRVRKWVYDTEYTPNEDNAPVNAPNGQNQEDDDATGREKNEYQEKEQDEEMDERKKRKKRSVSFVSEEYYSSDSSKSVG
ncbi:unnamed protein product [Rhizophagus irregularis]|nr:unnamed protein product [Rhizophagus irregularis]